VHRSKQQEASSGGTAAAAEREKRRVERERGHDGTYKWAVLKSRRRKKS
jgi:hypothetical protein